MALPQQLLELLFPPVCSLCRSALPPVTFHQSSGLCHSCRDELVCDRQQLCWACGRVATVHGEQGCPHCVGEKKRFDAVISLGPYRGPLRAAILRLKHAGQQSLAQSLGALLSSRLQEYYPPTEFDALIPVPMHWRKRLLRGDGASRMLADVVSRLSRVRLASRMLFCQRLTKKQSTLSRSHRTSNVHDSLGLRMPRRVVPKSILLLDDTMTTGATVNEAARVLRQAGIERVVVIVLARAAMNR